MLKFSAFVLCCVLTAAATPIKPKIEDVLKEATKTHYDYPVARVGWDKAVSTQPQRNPIYEQMRYPYTREGMLAQFTAHAVPDWRLVGMFGLLIFALRYYRFRKPHETAESLPEQQPQHEESVKRAA